LADGRARGDRTMADSSERLIGVQEVQPIAARWRRVIAYMLDLVILALPTLAGGFLFFDAAASLGEWGRLIGLVLIVGYFGYFNSRLCSGQSIGKSLLHLRVIRKDGTLLSPASAGLRALILAIPFQLYELELGDAPLLIECLVSFLSFGLLS